MSSMASSFNYSFRIPQALVEEEEPIAELQDGVLRLTFRKVEKKAPRKIKIAAKKTSKDSVK